MPIPKKAITLDALQLNQDNLVGGGSHEVYRVSFMDEGVEKTGFFKKLEPTGYYPELLAKFSVAVSVFKRAFQGKNSSEERLVFNPCEQLIGTLSVAMEGLKPFYYASQEPPTDPQEREQVIPSAQTLVEKNAIEILFGQWWFDNDDAHPGNLGFVGERIVDFDFDMFFSWLMMYIKPRLLVGVPKDRLHLSAHDWQHFPIIKDAKHFHHPTYDCPGQETTPVLPGQALIYAKRWADPAQFRLLAGHPVAQEQKLAVALKALLTYEPELMRAWLVEHFGDMPLNYTCLEAINIELRATYERQYPLLFNGASNTQSFVDFITAVYQIHYDSLYRLIVFNPGCNDNGHGVALPAMHDALYQKPSLYKKIVAWVLEQNVSVYSHALTQPLEGSAPRAFLAPAHANSSAALSAQESVMAEAIPEGLAPIAPAAGAQERNALQYNLDALQRRYHQIWRDAFAPSLKQLLDDSLKLTRELTRKLLETPSLLLSGSLFNLVPELVGKNILDDTLTYAGQLFGPKPKLSREEIGSRFTEDNKGKLQAGLLDLVDFTNEFYAIVERYYEKECSNLSEEDNLIFVASLRRLHDRYDKDPLSIRVNLGSTSSYAQKFNDIALGLRYFAEQANFQHHLNSSDEQMREVRRIAPVRVFLPYTHHDVLLQFNEYLFSWARKISAAEFSDLIFDVIKNKYSPSIPSISPRTRAAPVSAYLNASKNERGDIRLAHILSSGTGDEGALNTAIINKLARLALGGVNQIPSINVAMSSDAFDSDIALFVRSSVKFSKNKERFAHLYTESGRALFYKTLFSWVSSLESAVFKAMVYSSLNEYQQHAWGAWTARVTSGWLGTSRQEEVRRHLNSAERSEKILALIFLKGKESALNGLLFHKIIDEIKAAVKRSPMKQADAGYRLITQYHRDYHSDLLLNELAIHARELSPQRGSEPAVLSEERNHQQEEDSDWEEVSAPALVP